MSRTSLAAAMTNALRDYMVQGNPITGLEALIFFGVPNLTGPICRMRGEGWIVRTRRIPYARAIRRINEECKLDVPKSLPVREITLVEYWIER